VAAGTPLIDKLLATVIQLKASDLHITVGQPPVIRHHGRMRRLDTKTLDSDDTTALMKSITPDRCQQELQEKGGADFAIEFTDGYRFRVAVFKQRGSIGMVLRRIPSQFLTFEQLRMPDAIKRLITRPRGLLLVTGPTGSGKTTSLASMMNFLNENYDRHMITLEDPIEYFHKHKKCTVNQREINVDVPDFKEGIRRALRMDPDIILVGEMRDLETIRLALTAAETGHLVFGTLHTSSAAKTIDRIVDVFPAAEKDMVRSMLSESLRAVISQTLLKRNGGGRAAAHEIMIGTPAIRNLIREGKIAQMYSAIQTGQAAGMVTLDQCLTELVAKGVVSKEEARYKAANKDAI
jgi:twitching motility protein PilT